MYFPALLSLLRVIQYQEKKKLLKKLEKEIQQNTKTMFDLWKI